ncbi:Hpt domain-containing protein [Hephaestia sp. GCM10023244]|uniref:Hpt domain-containing protein n=1 Tax=unclassified Hephaestia TaxID=2631281 RepID=UPI002076E36D|nr:Hpt domain-containing protein [Hephaestia sp. MAHUQ-44]MCM8730166.1 Hpt domain-containing protein [Hephaestia sp. MAHUQ-44]
MAYDPGAIDAALAAAVGDEPALIAELREAFLDSVKRELAALESAADPESWRIAAWRLKGLAASFGAVRLMALADEGVTTALRDPAYLRRVRQAVARL